MATFHLPAAQIAPELAAELAHLLSLAFTERLRTDEYTDSERENLQSAAAALRAGELRAMPEHWLARFPTLQNLKRGPSERVPSLHLFDRRDSALVGHVACWEQEMRIDEVPVAGVYISDVGTHPAMTGRGVASSLLRLGVEGARQRGCAIARLGTGIPTFYERLGWRAWAGRATYTSPAGELTAEVGTMVLPLTERAGPNS